MSSFKITYGDLTAVSADVIVNSANRVPVCGGSTEAKIYEMAGYEDLLSERQKIGSLDVCEVAVTSAFRLNAKYLIFVSAPRYNEGRSGEEIALSICYQKILEKAVELGCQTLATPLLSSGTYRFPKEIALQIAKNSIKIFLAENPTKNSTSNWSYTTANPKVFRKSCLALSKITFKFIMNFHRLSADHPVKNWV